MERPLSTIGSSVATTSTSMHKRNVSSIKSLSRTQGPSITSLYITNLKLLNLDLLSDWPSLSTLSFSTTDARNRIRSAEWSLYQLFHLFDPHMTNEKLRPFFPPIEHLQSVNLRAALYRCLNELKKNGVLGRESTLRKTMLDDCSGDRFMELCLSFSSVVLRKVSLECRPRHSLPLAQKYAALPTLEKKEKDSLLPLAVAHKAALNRVLSTKTRKRESIMRLSKVMDAKEDELLDRVTAIEAQKPVITSQEHSEDLQMIEQALNDSAFGNTAFADAIVNGDPVRPGDMVLLQSKKEFLDQLDRDLQQTDTRRDSGVIDDIQQKAKAQRARVGQWQALYDQLRTDHPTAKSEQLSKTKLQAEELNFHQHHELGVEDGQPKSTAMHTQVEPIPTYMSRYDEILTNMREELRRTQDRRRATANQQQKLEQLRKPSITLDAVAGAASLPASRSPSRRSVSPTIPLRPGFDRRISSRSRSYQQPRVVSQRQPIPLKTEMFSPVKNSRSGENSPALSDSPAVEYAASRHPATQNDSRSKRESQGSVDTPTIDSGVGLGVNLMDSPVDMIVEEQIPVSTLSSMVGAGSVFPSSRGSQQSSLAERTRSSIASTRETAQSAPVSNVDSASSDVPEREQGRDTLLARTRQSMSAFTVPLPVRTASSPKVGSVNCAISVPKTRTAPTQHANDSDMTLTDVPTLSVIAQDQDQRKVTPRERLFDADAEASSVFKSRPKIATSPALAPSTPMFDQGSDVLVLDSVN